MPLFNPHGKYSVRLFVQGRWWHVSIDDVVPVGAAGGDVGGIVPLMPSSATSSVLWPQLLAKALLQAYQDDLNAQVLPAVTALTGWLPFQFPVTWDSLQRLHRTRSFCCLNLESLPSMEAPALHGTFDIPQ